MKLKIQFLLFFLFTSLLYAETHNTNMVNVYYSENEFFSLYDDGELLPERMGEPIDIEKSTYFPPEYDMYNVTTLIYENVEVDFWNGWKNIAKIKLKNDSLNVSSYNIAIGKTLLTEVMQYYSEYEVHKYNDSEDIIHIVFRTRDKSLMSEKAEWPDYQEITFDFDKKTKIVKAIELAYYGGS